MVQVRMEVRQDNGYTMYAHHEEVQKCPKTSERYVFNARFGQVVAKRLLQVANRSEAMDDAK